ncbi:MAG TPA: hypothetical protein VE620_01155 [Myxococcales bacterium]|jgi:hypothetical protein|nr:hypothetical protein [Myxococcales bacterium]
MIAALLAAAAVSSPPYSPSVVDDEVPALRALGPQPAGATAFTATAGRPFYSLRLAHGLWDTMDVAVGFDYSPDGVYRPAIETRVRAFRAGPTQLVARFLLARAFTTALGMTDTNDGEIALQFAVAPVPRAALFVEGSLLGTTDFSHERTAGFAQGVFGLAIALPAGVSLLGSIGILQGERGHRTVGSSGASVRF